MADALGSGSSVLTDVGVQIPPRPPEVRLRGTCFVKTAVFVESRRRTTLISSRLAFLASAASVELWIVGGRVSAGSNPPSPTRKL